jgi:ABC-2 type transport system ATP-binding protein
MKAEGKTMIITSHNEEDIKVLCDKVIEMDKGKMV